MNEAGVGNAKKRREKTLFQTILVVMYIYIVINKVTQKIEKAKSASLSFYENNEVCTQFSSSLADWVADTHGIWPGLLFFYSHCQ